jgi:lambda repressor-like predicted transcriptional regulator
MCKLSELFSFRIFRFWKIFSFYFPFLENISIFVPNNEPMKIYLEERLKESGISKDELAKRLGISNSSLTKKLNGPSRTNLQFLESVADALGISVFSLIDDEKYVKVGTFQSDGNTYEIRKIN